jgi:glycosyltransferase involved in cell wall biosynthesis/methylmalonyl-CoA mutase cobalamin-binding subunit
MAVKVLEQVELPAVDRGSVAVCIPVAGALEMLYRCIRSVADHTPQDVPVVITDQAPADPVLERFLSELDRRFRFLQLDHSPGEVALANAALDATAKADCVLLASHAVVFEGWLERLSEAGRSDTTVATASALGNNAGLLSVPGPYEPLPADVSLERLAADIATSSPRMLPRIPTADGHCVWISRAALELAGPLDPSLGRLRSAVIDFAQRCLLHGLVNVAADDLFVPSVMPELSAEGGALSLGDDRQLLERRYPYLRQALEEPPSPSFSQSISAARRALGKLSVTIDARILRGSTSGPQAETLELIAALHRADQVDVRVLLDPEVGGDVLAVLDRMPSVERLYPNDVGPRLERSAIAHRPYQVTSAEDLELLPRLGERVVITHLDMIAFHNPGYVGSFERWSQFRRVTRQALALADQVIFLSEHAAHDAIREGLLDPTRARVIPMAVNRGSERREQRRPAAAPEDPFLLCIGNDFRHKNRLFAVRLLEKLRERGWDGRLVLAGAHVGHGSSRGDEAAYLAVRRTLSDAVHELASVSEPEKTWLYANAAAVVYPTVYEGFGLIPFEAAAAGTPCLFAAQASLAEVLPSEAATLVPWDPEASAERVEPLLRDGPERSRHIDLIATAARAMHDWGSIGTALLETYEQATRQPFREASALAADAETREAELVKWVGLEENMGELVGPDAYLPPDVQRALLSVATRKRLRRPLFALLRVLYRLGYCARRRKA